MAPWSNGYTPCFPSEPLIQTTTSFFCSLPLTNLSYCIWDKSIICFLSDKSSHPCNAILHLYCCSSVICILMYFCSQNIGYKPDILTANRPLTVTLFRPALEPGLLCVLAGFPSAFFVVSRNFWKRHRRSRSCTIMVRNWGCRRKSWHFTMLWPSRRTSRIFIGIMNWSTWPENLQRCGAKIGR